MQGIAAHGFQRLGDRLVERRFFPTHREEEAQVGMLEARRSVTARTLATSVAGRAAVRTKQGAREGESRGRLADTPWAMKEIRVGQAAAGEKRAHDAQSAILAHDGAETKTVCTLGRKLDLGGLLPRSLPRRGLLGCSLPGRHGSVLPEPGERVQGRTAFSNFEVKDRA